MKHLALALILFGFLPFASPRAGGELLLRLRRDAQAPALSIALTDHFSVVADDAAARHAVAEVVIDEQGRCATGQALPAGQWHTLKITWDLEAEAADIAINGAAAERINLRRDSFPGVNYLRLIANDAQAKGRWLFDHVESQPRGDGP